MEETHQLDFFLHVKYQPYGYTRLIAEGIRRASPGGMCNTQTSQTLHQQVTMALMRLQDTLPSLLDTGLIQESIQA